MKLPRGLKAVLIVNVTAVALFVAAFFIPVFEPCRILYRSHQPIQDSLLCSTFSVFGTLSVGLFFIGLVCLAVRVYGFIREHAAGAKASRI